MWSAQSILRSISTHHKLTKTVLRGSPSLNHIRCFAGRTKPGGRNSKENAEMEAMFRMLAASQDVEGWDDVDDEVKEVKPSVKPSLSQEKPSVETPSKKTTSRVNFSRKAVKPLSEADQWLLELAEESPIDASQDDDDEEVEEYETQVSIAPTELLEGSRTTYRHAQNTPEWLLEKQKQICSVRTNKQIRRRLKDLELRSNRDVTSKFLTRPIGWYDDKKETAEAKRSTAKRYGPEETTAYSFVFLPRRAATIAAVLEQASDLLRASDDEPYRPRTVLDFGCGPGTAAAAMRLAWGEDTEQIRYTGIEPSQSMLDAARITASGILPQATFWTKVGDLVKRAVVSPEERFDMVVAAYTLSELPTDAARRAATQTLYELLKPNGVLVMVEEGDPQGSHTVRSARQFLIDMTNTVKTNGMFKEKLSGVNLATHSALAAQKRATENQMAKESEGMLMGAFTKLDSKDNKFGEKRDGNDRAPNYWHHHRKKKSDESEEEASTTRTNFMLLTPPTGYEHTSFVNRVVAPCTHDGKCPLASGVWCSFSQRTHNQLSGGLRDDRYSYVIVRKSPRTRPTVASAAADEIPDSNWVSGREETDSLGQRAFEPLPPGDLSLQHIMRSSPRQLLTKVFQEEHEGLPLGKAPFAFALDDVHWPDYESLKRREDNARLIRTPLKKRGHVQFDLCTPNGEIERYIHAKKTLRSMPRLYVGARRSSWGGLLPVFMSEAARSPSALGATGVELAKSGASYSDEFVEQNRKSQRRAHEQRLIDAEKEKEEIIARMMKEEEEEEEDLASGRLRVPQRGAESSAQIAKDIEDSLKTPEERAMWARMKSIMDKAALQAALADEDDDTELDLESFGEFKSSADMLKSQPETLEMSESEARMLGLIPKDSNKSGGRQAGRRGRRPPGRLL